MLDEYAVSESFKVLKVNDHVNNWMEAAYDSIQDIEDQYKAKGWKIEYQSISDEDWVFISKLK